MIDESKLTPLFSADQPPTRVGPYMLASGEFAHFDGQQWGVSAKTPLEAHQAYAFFGPHSHSNEWRGLVECQQPDLFASCQSA